MRRAVRFLLRRALKAACALAPRALRPLVLRLPFSRFSESLPSLVGGREHTWWRGVRLEVDPGELEGFFRYFHPDGPDPEYDWLLRACVDARGFVDVGANHGIYALALASVHPRLRVLAIEPDDDNVVRLQRNLALNPALVPRVVLERAAAGAESGTGAFARSSTINSGTGRLVHDGGVAVRVRTLEDLLRQHAIDADVIKIDVEGAEGDVLAGLGGLQPAAVAVELHPDRWPVPGAERVAHQGHLIAMLAQRRLVCRFLLDERDWADSPPVGHPWPARLHLFAARLPD